MERILVIDDDDQYREMLQDTLQREGYEVTGAPDGEVGLRLQHQQQFDLVITDIIMPNKEGIGTIMELRKHYPELKIIAISGGGKLVPNDYLEIAEKLGANCSLAKPFKRAEFLGTVSDLLVTE